MKLQRLQCVADMELAPLVQGLLALAATGGWEEQERADGSMAFTVFAENGDFIEGLADSLKTACPGCRMEVGPVEIPDPLEAWKEFFTPVPCGECFVVLPPWLADTPQKQQWKVLIEPKSAFGTGHHASTALCLELLSDLLEDGRISAGGRFLDLGCGSGILGLAASLAGLKGIGADIDPLAIENAIENRELNNASGLSLITGSLEDISQDGFDLAMANILAGPLIEMAPELCGRLKKGGWLILSGILKSQAQDVGMAYAQCGMAPAKVLEREEWSGLLMRRL